MNSSRPSYSDVEHRAILRAILNTAVDAIISIDCKGLIYDVNPATCIMFGYEESELIGQNISILMPTPYREEHDQYLSAYLETGVARIIGQGREVTAVRKDGSQIELDLAVSEVRIGGQPMFTGILRDMTSRNQAEAAARRERTFSDNLFETANAIVAVLNPEGKVFKINPHLEELSGYTSAEVCGQDWFETFLPESEQLENREIFLKMIANEPVPGNVSTLVTKDGHERTISWSGCVLHDADEIREGALIIGKDITALKKAEAQLIAQERLAAIGQMVAGLAHESRNSLQRASACLDMLELDAEGESLPLIHRSQVALNELHKLYEEVRNYAAPMLLEWSSCSLLELCQTTWENLHDQWGNTGIRLRFECQMDLGTCVCDRERMQQVFRNIFENSLCTAPPQSEVIIFCQKITEDDQQMIQLSIENSGPELTPLEREQIFTPFFTTKTKGTGLGMAIAKRIVEAHGGSIGVGDPVHKGTRIVLSLPVEHFPTFL